ncbi:MAG: sigma-54-dependent Fis family transcriptional regulator [Clostridiales Family XIII bacterium]|jgi:transcriptional regulator of acetoin/glycerol metabolism|nr:sigma-54-dependent Fis family transcriptional regulator [Clostridiales Family XIII bacterium]
MNSTLNPYFYAYNPELLTFENAWVDFIRNNYMNESVIKPEIASSWLNCKKDCLDPLKGRSLPPISDADLEEKLHSKEKLLETVMPFMHTLNEMALGTGFRILFADEEGYILKSIGDAESLVLCKKTHTLPGANHSEAAVGTNAIGLAISLRKPIQVAGGEHYVHSLHCLVCSAAPIIDDDNALLGVLSVMGRYETIHGHTLGMVITTAEAIKNRIQILKINGILAENKIHKHAARFTFEHIIGQSPDMQESLALAQKAAKFDARVILEGESGTGKEMFAQGIHNSSFRAGEPFIAVDCGTIPRELLESQLFGYERGAFTGAKKEGSIGIFELADKGTLFFDEIGNMPFEMQIKLLRVLQEGVFYRLGGTKPIRTDVRVIAATNADLKSAVESGAFRHDLFYRLNVFHIKMPALRERKEDIPLLVEHFLSANSVDGSRILIDKKAMSAIENYNWPGNIRQLSNAIERAIIMSKDGKISLEDLPMEIQGKEHDVNIFFNGQKSLDATMKDYAKFTLALHGGNISRTAEILDISRTTLYKLIRAAKGVHEAAK